MFGMADLVVVSAIKEALHFLSANPKHIEFILSGFCPPALKDLVGDEYVKDCIDYITGNRVEVAPYYQIDKKKRPSIAVVAQYTEGTQFIGDFGDTKMTASLTPKEYVKFDVLSKDGCKVMIPSAYKLEDKLWVGIEIVQGDFVAKIKGIMVRDNVTILILDKEVPDGILKINWRAVSGTRDSGVVINASIEDVTVQLNLQTLGDYSIHRLLSTIVRYCIKKQRLVLDKYGLQVASVTQSPPLLTEESENEFQTVFTITGKMTDRWIESEFDYPDANANVKINLIAEPIDEEKYDEVELDG